jgi:hypothetical protein
MSRFITGSDFRWPFRQGDLREIAEGLDEAEADLRGLMRRVSDLSEALSQAMTIFGEVPGAPERHHVSRAAADVFLGLGFPENINTVADLARHARALEGAVLAAHGPDEGSIPLASTLQGDERDRLIADLAALWRETGRAIPWGDADKRKPFREFVDALHVSIGAGKLPDDDHKAKITSVAD